MKNHKKIERLLPFEYKILPWIVPFVVPGFEKQCWEPGGILAPIKIRPEIWYERFRERLISCVGKRFLPVCRISDGEFRFLLGDQPSNLRHGCLRRVWLSTRQFLRRATQGGAFSASTLPGVSSGEYSEAEWQEHRSRYSAALARIGKSGVLGLHLSFGPQPFQEQYFPAFAQWCQSTGVSLSIENYIPFYFVYALLRGPDRAMLFKGRRILVVNAAVGEKSARIQRHLIVNEGARDVIWKSISGSRALFEEVDVRDVVGKVDIALVGAGVGKVTLLTQLEQLSVPCIDAGFVLEVMADPRLALKRPMMIADGDMSYERAAVVGCGRASS